MLRNFLHPYNVTPGSDGSAGVVGSLKRSRRELHYLDVRPGRGKMTFLDAMASWKVTSHVLIRRDEVCRITVCLRATGPAKRTRTSEPRDRELWTLAASIHQAEINHGTWSSRRQSARVAVVRRSSSGLHDALAECWRSDIMGGCCATYCCATPLGTSVLSPRQDVVR